MPNSLLKNRLREWEIAFEHPLSEVELKIWYETFEDLRASDSVLTEALRLVQSKAVKMPKPGHLTAALEIARETIANHRRAIDNQNAAKVPHISELPQAERDALARKFREDMTRVLAKTDLRPSARSPEAARIEANRQRQALAGTQSHSGPLASEITPIASAGTLSPATPIVEKQEETFEATDEDLPENLR